MKKNNFRPVRRIYGSGTIGWQNVTLDRRKCYDVTLRNYLKFIGKLNTCQIKLITLSLSVNLNKIIFSSRKGLFRVLFGVLNTPIVMPLKVQIMLPRSLMCVILTMGQTIFKYAKYEART